jgi:hypothetical protein
MLKKGPTRWNRWWNENGGIVLIIGLVVVVAIASLIMRQVVPISGTRILSMPPPEPGGACCGVC